MQTIVYIDSEFDDGCSLHTGLFVETDNRIVIRSLHGLQSLNLSTVMPSDHKNMYIVCLEMGYFFWYDRVKGFGPRKKNFLKNKMGEILQQTFVCFREGKREDLV